MINTAVISENPSSQTKQQKTHTHRQGGFLNHNHFSKKIRCFFSISIGKQLQGDGCPVGACLCDVSQLQELFAAFAEATPPERWTRPKAVKAPRGRRSVSVDGLVDWFDVRRLQRFNEGLKGLIWLILVAMVRVLEYFLKIYIILIISYFYTILYYQRYDHSNIQK